MRFLVDQNISPELADLIRRAGHEAEHVLYLGLDVADDRELIRFARQGDWVIVSRDADFSGRAGGDSPATWFQLVWVRLGNTTNPELFAAWEAAWPSTLAALERGDPLVEIGGTTLAT